MTTSALRARHTLAEGRPTAAPSPLSRFVVLAVGVSVFGPYVTGSIRTEQIVIYGLAASLLLFTFFNIRMAGAGRFLIPWLAYIGVATIGVLVPSRAVAPFEAGNVLAGLDNILAPLAIMLLIWSTVADRDARYLLTLFSKLIAWGMALNGVLAVIATTTDISEILRPFWSTSEATITTAELAAQLGRYGGIFNQPAEAGYLYGIAGIAAVYAWKHRPVLLALLLTLITLGGVISVSKVFIIGALPFVVFYWVWSQRNKVAVVFAGALVLLGVVQSGLFDQWTGVNFLARLVNPDGDGGLLAFYTAGRLEQGSSQSRVVEAVLEYNPLTGVGARGWLVPYDGALAEALVYAGIIGVILYAVVVVSTFTLRQGLVDARERMFATLFAIITAGACLGFSPLTANRASTVAWMIIALLVLVQRSDREGSTTR